MKLQDSTQDLPVGSSEAAGTASGEAKLESHGLYRLGLVYARQVYRFRWFIIVLWIIGVAVSVPFAAQLPAILSGGGFSLNSSDSAHVDAVITDKLHQPPSSAMVVFQSSNTLVTDVAYQKEVSAFIARARQFPHVSGVENGGVGKDGRTTFVVVNFTQSDDNMTQYLDDFQKLIPSGAAASPARPYLTGDVPVNADFSTITQSDVERAEVAALPIALLVLLIVFGSLVAAAMPLILAILVIPVTLAVIYAIAIHYATNVFILNIVSVIGLGISIDYSLFMTRRFRDELSHGRTVCEAVAWTVATSGEAILFSGLIVMIGFFGMLLIGVQFMTSMGIGGAIVVAFAVMAALTLLPALFSVLGPRINALRIPFLSRFTLGTRGKGARGTEEEESRSFWQRWALGVMKRPIIVVVVVTSALIALGWPIFSISIGSSSILSLPPDIEARQGFDVLNKQFPATSQNPVYIIAQTPNGSSMLNSDNLAHLSNLTQWLSTQPHVTGVTSIVNLPPTPGSPALSEQQLTALYSSGAYQQNASLKQLVSSTTNGDVTLVTVQVDTKFDSPEDKALISTLRSGDKAAAQGLQVFVGGSQADSLDFNNYLYGNFPRAIIFIMIATYVLLLLMFRSLLLPLKAILMNVLSVSVTYGVLVFIFQWGNFSNILNFTASGTIDSTVPILLFCILFGLSMDYEVFLLSRIYEEWLRTHNNRFAVARGLEKTGGVITNAALLFVIVTGAFTFTSITITKETGLGMTVAVLVDATIIRSLLVPATMRLLGRWNWWLPGRSLPPRQTV